MRIHLTAQGFELTSAIKSHAEERFQRLSAFSEASKTEVHVVLHPQRGGELSKAEVKFRIRHFDVFAESKDADLYRAISECAQKAYQQLSKHHDKQKEHAHVKQVVTGNEDRPT
jgi:ribosomal subunit interface protein